MKVLFTIPLVVFYLLGFSQTTGNSDESLVDLENKRLEAIISHNHDFLVNLYDDQFHGVIASGHTVDKTKVIEFLESSNPHVVQSLEDVKAKVYGMIAVTTGKVVSKSKSGSVMGQMRFTNIYLKKTDQWKMIESQGTVILLE